MPRLTVNYVESNNKDELFIMIVDNNDDKEIDRWRSIDTDCKSTVLRRNHCRAPIADHVNGHCPRDLWDDVIDRLLVIEYLMMVGLVDIL